MLCLNVTLRISEQDEARIDAAIAKRIPVTVQGVRAQVETSTGISIVNVKVDITPAMAMAAKQI